ncbi:MAG: branched-chain amino acid ABC transporter permease [Candidatus Portiera sp.]|nr:branched-chain amino acid ABC transporter permease [Portiera sp.]
MNQLNQHLHNLKLSPLASASLAILLVIYILVLPIYVQNDNYFLTVLINSTMLSVASLGVWVTFSIGRINISQGAFCMIGGYATAILMKDYNMSFWIAIVLSGVFSAFVGVLLGIPLLRLKGVYFAMITLSLTETIRLVMLNGTAVTKGATGIIEIPRPQAIEIGGFTLLPDFGGSLVFLYYISAVILIISALCTWRLSSCRIGVIFRSLRQNEELATSLGINVANYRVMAFSFCCFLGGIAGSIFAVFQGSIFPSSYTVNDSVFYMLYCFLGGLDFVFGPIIGAFILTIGFEYLQALQEYQTVIYGILMISLMLFLPNGVLTLPDIFRGKKGDKVAEAKK